MPADAALLRRLAGVLPDVPRWVETREILLDGTAKILGLRESTDVCFVALDVESGFIGIVGEPPAEAIETAARLSGGKDMAVCEPRARRRVAAAIPAWNQEETPLFLLEQGASLPDIPKHAVRLLGPEEIALLEGIPPVLREEFRNAVEWSPLAATIVDGRPVSFCYAGAMTERLWDISIDTLERDRGRGYAGLCVAYMISLMRERSKEPMWSALEGNVASRRLATKLGFVEVDRMVAFLPPGSTYT